MINVSSEMGMETLRGDTYCTASYSHLSFDPNSDVKDYETELITVGLLPPTIIYQRLFTLIINIYGKSATQRTIIFFSLYTIFYDSSLG